MNVEIAAWLIFLIPLASFVVIATIIRPFLNKFAALAGYLTIFSVGTAFLISVWILNLVTDEGAVHFNTYNWLRIGDVDVTVGLLIDPLTSIMLLVVTSVSLLIQIYSLGYMRGDSGYARYFAYMSLFTASMVGMVMASNIIQIYIFWELVGVSSYLLIGFWYNRPRAAAAAKKAFIVTRLGDLGFLLAILYLMFNAGVFVDAGQNALDVSVINTALPEAVKAGLLGVNVITWVTIGIFAGAVGKSGQIPLHTWLPDAMEGPTPVSALIHAATMVTAGVFLVARFFPLFEASTTSMSIVALVGGVTAIFAASMGLVMNDIKRVLAYSTISQLGYMMLALGTGAYVAAIFHLFTHAFFKAALFLGAGSINHATGTFDMRFMGGLRSRMRWTYATFLIGSLSLAGIFPLAGFWSKDEILSHAWGSDGVVSQLVFWLALIAVFMTAFYMFRALFMTFEGEFRGGAGSDPEMSGSETHSVHLVESPVTMVSPLIILGIASVIIGFLVNPVLDIGLVPTHWLTVFLAPAAHVPEFNFVIGILSTVIALSGIGLAFSIYVQKKTISQSISDRLSPIRILLSRRYYFDEVYEKFFTIRILYGGLARFLDAFDRVAVDGLVRLIDRVGRNIGYGMAQAQTGQLQLYGLGIALGVLIVFGAYLLWQV